MPGPGEQQQQVFAFGALEAFGSLLFEGGLGFAIALILFKRDSYISESLRGILVVLVSVKNVSGSLDVRSKKTKCPR